jgi:hypothetical protein
MDRDTSLALMMKALAVLLAAPVLLLLFAFPERFELLPNYARVLLFLPVSIAVIFWSLSSPRTHQKREVFTGAIIAVMAIVGAACWYVFSPDARA